MADGYPGLSRSSGLCGDELLTRTRAVRRRLDLTRPVPPQLVRECLAIAQQAPSGSGRHRTHWVVVTDPDRRAAMGKLYVAAFAEYRATLPERVPEAIARTVRSAEHLSRHLGEVPVLVLPCVAAPGVSVAGSQAALWGSVMPAVWSYMLAARNRGLGTTWTTAHLRREAEMAELLGIPAGVWQAALIPTAYHVGSSFRPARRPPLSEVLHLDGW